MPKNRIDVPTNVKVAADRLFRDTVRELAPVYGQQEAESLADCLLEGFFGVTASQRLLKATVEIFPQALEQGIARLKNEEPVQHIVGYAWFYSRKFSVSPRVLIPRQETEELVHWILQSHHNLPALTLLDVGTGSGCIPITLQLEAPGLSCHALDVSPEGLQVARLNSNNLGADVAFYKVDILKESVSENLFNLIVSNPPYIREFEKTQMRKNVLAFDPPLALFVPDTDPLLFYRRIASEACKALKKDGWLYFEINEALGREVAALLIDGGFGQVEIKKDLQGKDRMARGVKLYHS